MQATCAEQISKSGNEYDNMLTGIVERFRALGNVPLFTTDAEGLWELYLDGFPASERQFHNCSACRHFIRKFGGLVTIGERGTIWPAVFADTPSINTTYGAAITAMFRAVSRAKVTGVFLCSDSVWGTPRTGDWTHFHVYPDPRMVFNSRTMTAGQAMAEKAEDHKNVLRALEEFTPELLAQALALLNSEALYRAEKVIGPAKWLSELHSACSKANRSNVVWRSVATAPAGFCHPRSSMVGTLLEDIASGMDFAQVSRRFADKMRPDQYLRPQAAPSVGAIQQAEKLVEQLGIARSLERRFARLDEIQTIWKPAKPENHAVGHLEVFGHLVPKAPATLNRINVPPQSITWEKFARTVLPTANTIELMVPRYGNFAAIVTAEHQDAPPILQWDTMEQRNPFSWYMYTGGSPATKWGLVASTWHRVTAVTMQPSMWNGGFAHYGSGALIVLDGAKEARSQSSALFPEILKSELHGVRSVIEAHSGTRPLSGAETASACGLMVNGNSGAHVRVTASAGVRAEYLIDRWD